MAQSPSAAELLESFRAAAGAPRLIWYGVNSERVELSGRVLENWVAKTSNLLVEELDAEAGTAVVLAMPPHWKSIVWALACWQVGAVTRLQAGAADEAGGAADVRVAMDAGENPAEENSAEGNSAGKNSAGRDGELQVLVAPGALDLRWPGTLPEGAVDYSAIVRAFGDVYLDPPAGADAVLVTEGGSAYTFADLRAAPLTAEPGPLTAEAGDAGTGSDTAAGSGGARTVATPGVWLVPASLPLLTVLRAAVQIWSAGGSVVLVHPEVEVSQRLIDGERITARLAA